jgi:hypothetical protein
VESIKATLLFPRKLRYLNVSFPRKEFVIITRPAIGKMQNIHHRMPIILTLEQLPLWHGPHWNALMTDKPPEINFYPVASFALMSGSTGEECIRPAWETSKSQSTLDKLVKSQEKDNLKKIL